MSNVTKISIGYAELAYVPEVGAVPASEHKDGSVTIRNAAIKGMPAYYDALFRISADLKEGPISFTNILSLRTVVQEADEHASYHSITWQAARKLAPMLRSLADQIDLEISELDNPKT